MNYKHLFLDLDNTLLDFNKASESAFQKVLEMHKKPLNGAYSQYKIINRKVWAMLEQGKINSEELRKIRFQKFLEHMNWEGNGYEWNQEYLYHLSLNHDYVDGAKEILSELKEDYKFHIITNGLKEVQRPRLKLSGLEDLSESITISDEIGVAKPQAEFFSIAIENAGITDTQNILVIGDNYDSDILGAHLYGLPSCWFNYSGQKTPGTIHTYQVNKINEIKKILQ